MAIEEVFLGAFLQVLFDRLASRALLDFISRYIGLPSEIKKWERKLKMIEAVLVNAEEKQLTDRAVKIWLDDLRNLAYDVEDVLDEFATEALESKLIAEDDEADSASKLIQSIFPSCFTGFKFKDDIEDINSRLDELCELKNELGLVKITERTSSSPSISLLKRTPSTCLPPEYDVGRYEEKKKIFEMMSTSNLNTDFNFRVISIVGMGGIGKTTLVRSVYNDSSALKFHLRAWVCVSENFDVMKISKAILESLTFSPCDCKELNQVQLMLKEKIAEKKLLLVLDDVWSNDYAKWVALRLPFMAGAPGSIIIVTTRLADVALTMGSLEYCELKPLSDDDCWNVFQKHVFENRDASLRENLESVRERVVDRCGGLPLVAKTLGGLLRCKQRHKWEEVLNNEIWELSSDECDILPVLKLSYQHLPSHLKRCFAYCSVLPRDYEFEPREIILLWMAEGFVPETKGNMQMEDLGGEYFQDLLSRSFFQRSNNDGSKYIMHDLVNNLARWVSGDTSFRLEDGLISNRQWQKVERLRHSSYICSYCDGKNRFQIFDRAKRLRTFLPHSFCKSLIPYTNNYINSMVVSDLLPGLKRLRVLSLRGYYVVDLPDSISGLKHLRYLNLAYTKIRSLPESASFLFNLQTLNLRNCSKLVNLPSKMKNLINLRYLDIKGTDLIKEMPIGMKILKSLRNLSNFVVGKSRGSCVEDLKSIKFLQGELCISSLENVNDLEEAPLSEMKELKALILEWESQFGVNSRNLELEQKVMSMLRPHTNLEELSIKCYGGRGFPSWIGDSSYSNMKFLRLMNCKNCTSLPLLVSLCSLKELTIKGMRSLKTLGSEIYAPSLETLHIEDLKELQNWESDQQNEHLSKFPLLRELSIIECPELSSTLPYSFPLLEKLVIRKCVKLVVLLANLPKLHNLEIFGCKKVVYSSATNCSPTKFLILSSISELENCSIPVLQSADRLKIENCENFIDSWQNELSPNRSPELHGLTSITELCINNCPSLVLIPEVQFLSLLKKLEIKDCGALTSLPEGIKRGNAHLESLKIKSCHSLKSIVQGQLPVSLKHLWIGSCKKLLNLLDFGDDAYNLASSTMHEENVDNNIRLLLEYMYIFDCPSLKRLSSSSLLPAALKHLEIDSCSKLTTLSSGNQLPEGLQELRMVSCPKLELDPDVLRKSLSLEAMDINFCKKLKFLPDGLHDLSFLYKIEIYNCPSLVSFPQGGLPSKVSKFTISKCKNLQVIPDGIYKLKFLQELTIRDCPRITSLPEEGFPISITSLSITGDLKIYKPLIEWGFHKLTSLRNLKIDGCPNAVSFPEENISMALPSSLTRLNMVNFPKLKCLSTHGFKKLSSLEYMSISNCPNLALLPNEGMPSSLLELYISRCRLLQEQLERDRGQQWHKIAHIPYVELDWKFIYDPSKFTVSENSFDDYSSAQTLLLW